MSVALLASRRDLELKIKANGDRLAELNGPDDKRIKKRVLQTLGKLKKQLLDVNSKLGNATTTSTSVTSTTKSGTEDNDECDIDDEQDVTEMMKEDDSASNPIPVWNKKKAKLKLKIVNAEIADLALKKQLKMANKRFNWLAKHGLCPGTQSVACC